MSQGDRRAKEARRERGDDARHRSSLEGVPVRVVGIGASAGGLDACTRFFGAMPDDTGMAFIVVMHLSPDYESHVTELLRAHTDMRVVQARGEQTLEPDCIYVVAPGRFLVVDDGAVISHEMQDLDARHKPIDVLLTSLATDQEARAVGVILSGGGSDGADGLRRIRERGGQCLVQDPETAEYDGMPRSALMTLVVSMILPPDELARALAWHVTSGQPEEVPSQRPSGFEQILDLLGQSYGIDFSGAYKRHTLERRTRRRMSLEQIPEWSEYLDRLRGDPAEVRALYREILIGVTSFFRDPEVWERLAKSVIPELLSRRDAREPLRIWVAGCASGEECYSLAIVFLEVLHELELATKLQIFATDVDEDALAVARAGVYPPSIADDVSEERLARFFRPCGDGNLQITSDVRGTVTFAAHNLLEDPPLSNMDLVSCRNLLIYLEPHAQKHVVERIHFALKPGGLMLLGVSETVGRHRDLFRDADEVAPLFRSSPRAAAHLRPLQLARPRRRATPPVPSSPRDPSSARLLESIVLRRYVQPCAVVDESFDIRALYGPTYQYLSQPTGELRHDLLSWVRPTFYTRLRAALERARTEKKRVRVDDLRIEREDVTKRVECTIEPIAPEPDEGPLFVVAFREGPKAPPVVSEDEQGEAPAIAQLQVELSDLHAELKATVSELEQTNDRNRASHEELLALNEDLQSNNEELEASKEELQSLNEELVTVNNELEAKNAALRRTKADLSNLLVSTKIPIIFLDRDLRIRLFTPMSQELMHFQASDQGRSIEDIHDPFQDSALIGACREVLRTMAPMSSDVQARDGRWFERTILPYQRDHAVEGVCIAFRDITASKRWSQAIDAARIYAETIVHTIRTPLLVLDDEMRVDSANEAFFDTFQVSASESEGRSVFELGDGCWNTCKMHELLDQVLEGDEDVHDYEVDVELDGGQRCIFLVNASRMRPDSLPARILVAFEDITGRREAEDIVARRSQELRRDKRRIDDFLAMLGHELRNPLAAVMHGLDLLALAPDDREQQEQTREMIQRQAQRIAGMLDQLLDVARLTRGKIEIAHEPVDLTRAVRAAVETLTPLIRAHRHHLELHLPDEGDITVRGDCNRLTQIVENLLSNAAKYTDDGGRIELSVEGEAETARIRVRDNGIGIDAELLEHVFEPFIQAPRGLDRRAGGLGLGLPMVKGLVTAHHGSVEAHSDGPGQGSEFIVTLSRIESARAARAAEAPTRPEARRILVVDDERDSADTLAQILEMRGYSARAVYDGPAALDAVREFEPDIILLDIGLPEMDGYEVASRLCEEHGRDAFLLVAMTGYQRDDERLEAAGFDKHLLKPPDLGRLHRWLGVPAQSP